MDDLERMLRRWTMGGIITPEQAEEIRAIEGSRSDAKRSVPVLAEVIAYVGAILILSAAIFVASQLWGDLPSAARLTVVVLATALLWASGWWIRGGRNPMVKRLTSVLWFLSAGGLAWTVDLIATDVLDIDDGYALVIGIPLAVYSWLLYLARRAALQQVALAVSAALICGGLSDIAGGDDWFGVLLWVLGAFWIFLTRSGSLEPRGTGFVLGSIGVLGGAEAVALEFFESTEAEGIVLGLLSAAALLYLSVAFGEMVLLAVGIAGLFIFLTQAIEEYLGDGLGGPAALLVAGIALLLLALLSVRLKQKVEASSNAKDPEPQEEAS